MRATTIVAGVGAGLIGVVSFVVFTNRSPASAHGGMTFPATRTYACYADGRAGGNGGDLQPTNPACIAAIEQGGKQPLWDWFGNLLPNAGKNSRQVVPDGKLCGPSAAFDAYNAPRADWPVTNVQPGATVTLRYNAWAPHPGTWTQWVTRDGFDVTKPLKWSDLDPTPFSVVTNPPISQGGVAGAEYTWRATLPNKSGRHIIYSIWERSDSPEVFYNCSDVNFGGTTTPTTSGPTTTTATTAPTTTTTVPRPTSTSTWPSPGGACVASSKVESQWPGGFQATVTLANPGTTTITGWQVALGLPAGTSVGTGWNGVFSGTTVTPAAWNRTIAPGQTITFGYLGSGSASPAPTATCLG